MTYPAPIGSVKERRETYGKDVGQVALVNGIQYLDDLPSRLGFMVA